jgi:hypothetical protein
LVNALEGRNIFSSYIAISPYIVNWNENWNNNIFSMEQTVFKNVGKIPCNLYICYGELEYPDIKGPDSTLIKTISGRNYKGLNLLYNEYEGLNHQTINRPGYVDGILLFLSEGGAGYEDISLESFSFDFSSQVEIYDWSCEHSSFERAAAKRISYEADIDADDGSTGSMRVSFDFSDKAPSNTGLINFIFNNFYNFSGKKFKYSLYIPEGLAELGYSLRFFITSTNNFTRDIGEPIPLNKSGWNTYSYEFKDLQLLKGDIRELKELGIIIEGSGTPWAGDILIDNIRW